MKNYTDIKSVKDACKVLNLDINKAIPSFEYMSEEDREPMIAHCKLIIVAKAINKLDGYVPNWNDLNESKYTSYFKSTSSGFSYSDCVYWISTTYVGSRLCFRTSDIAKYVGTQFLELYKTYFIINEEVEEITIEQIQKELGRKIKIVESKN